VAKITIEEQLQKIGLQFHIISNEDNVAILKTEPGP
jgi:hypothetical protein